MEDRTGVVTNLFGCYAMNPQYALAGIGEMGGAIGAYTVLIKGPGHVGCQHFTLLIRRSQLLRSCQPFDLSAHQHHQQRHDHCQGGATGHNKPAVLLPYIGEGELWDLVIRRHPQTAGELIHRCVVGRRHKAPDASGLGSRVGGIQAQKCHA